MNMDIYRDVRAMVTGVPRDQGYTLPAFPPADASVYEVADWINSVILPTHIPWYCVISGIANIQSARRFTPPWLHPAFSLIGDSFVPHNTDVCRFLRDRRTTSYRAESPHINPAFDWAAFYDATMEQRPNLLFAFNMIAASIIWSFINDRREPFYVTPLMAEHSLG